MYKLKINEKLKSDILNNIPQNYSNLEKALFIYKELCKKLQYSMEYFIDESSVRQKYVNTENLQYVDGETNKDVVCFTFNAILGELLHDAGVCQELSFDFGSESGKFSFFHGSVFVNIDKVEYEIDGTYGILDNNDLTLSKYSSHTPKGWSVCDRKKEDQELLDSSIKKVYSQESEHSKNTNKYIQLKQKEGSYLHLPFEQRVQLFFNMIKDCPDYSVLSFNYLIKLKHLLFTNEEYSDSQQIDKKIDLQFVKEQKSKTLKAILFVNPKGYTNDRGYENFEDLSIYEIDIKNKTVTPSNIESIRKKIQTRDYISHRYDKTINDFKMMAQGKLDVRPITNGPPIYDHHQNVLNAVGYERKLLKENIVIPYEPGE